MPDNEPLQKSAISTWLTRIGQDRQWLADQLKVSAGSVNQWLSAKGIFPEDRQESVRRLMAQENESPLIGDPEGNLVSFTLAEFERIEQTRQRLNYETRPPMYRDAILAYIEADVAAQRKILPISKSPSPPVSESASIAAEETVYVALQKLVKAYEPDPTSGGFDADDISNHCSLSSDAIQQHLHSLSSMGLITDIEAPMGAAWLTHYSLPV